MDYHRISLSIGRESGRGRRLLDKQHSIWLFAVVEDLRALNVQGGLEAIGPGSSPVEKDTSTTEYHGLSWITLNYRGAP